MVVRKIYTVDQLFDEVCTKQNANIEADIEIDLLNAENFLNFSNILILNRDVKSITIRQIDTKNFNQLDIKKVNSLCEVLANKKNLESLDFGTTYLPETFAQEFVKAFGKTGLSSLSLQSTKEVQSKLAYYKKRNQWLIDVSIVIFNQYISLVESKFLHNNELLKNEIENRKALIGKIHNQDQSNDLELILRGHYNCLKNLVELEQVFKEFKSVKRFIKDMYNYCFDLDNTPMHFLVAREKIDTIHELKAQGFKELLVALNIEGQTPIFCLLNKLESLALLDVLISYGNDINAKDYEGNTFAHYAVHSNNSDVIKALQSRKLQFDVKNIFGDSPFSRSLASNLEIAISTLKALGICDPTAEKTIRKRSLFFIFGQKKFQDLGQQELRIKEGGYLDESYVTLIYYFKAFAEENKQKSFANLEKFSKIILALENALTNSHLTKDQFLSKLRSVKPGEYQFYRTGAIQHGMGVCIEKIISQKTQKISYLISISERGLFANLFTKCDERIISVKEILVREQEIENIVELLNRAFESDSKRAAKIFSKKIEEISFAYFKDYDPIKQKLMKLGLCYFSNPLTLVYLLVMKQFGQSDNAIGVKIFKEFTLFMRQHARADYLPFIKNENEMDKLLMDESQKIIDAKRSHLSQ